LDYLTYTFNSNKKSSTSGGDSSIYKGLFIPEENQTTNPEIFIKYPYPIYYDFNSRGFRGPEWPSNLNDVIWCIGDSFTTGIGIPFEHTWPSILQYYTNIPCINLGIDGAANKLLMNIAKQVIEQYNPKHIVIMWSYPHRRYEDPWKFTHYKESTTFNDDLKDFTHCFNSTNSLHPNIYNTIIPRLSLPVLKDLIKPIHNYPVLDLGRDNWHFDYLTAEIIVSSIVKHFNLESSNV
jgi:hypothetical protein